MKRIQHRIYELLEVAHPDDTASRFTDLFLFVLIALNVIAVIVETVEDLATQYALIFRFFEIFSVAVFSVEYVLRLWTCVADRRYAHPVTGRLRFAGSWHAVIDLLAILPFYLPMFLPVDLRVLRALRFFRLLRFLKLSRYSESLRIFGKVLRSERTELMVALFIAGVLLVIGSSFLYLVEHEAQPDVFSKHSGSYVVGRGDADDGGLWRRLSHNSVRPLCRRHRRHHGRGHVRFAGRHTCIRLCARNGKT